MVIGEGQSRIHVEPNHSPVFIQSLDRGHRPGTINDLIDLYKLHHASEICDINGAVPVEPSDLKGPGRRARIFYELIKHTDKALRFTGGTKAEIEQDFEMLCLAKGDPHWLDDGHACYHTINPLSPLAFDKKPLESILAYARRNQPVSIMTSSLSGVTSPLSFSGVAVLQNAEVLSAITLLQLVRPGLPCFYGPASMRPNLQTAAYITGSPESDLINIINFQLVNDYYHIPIRSMAGMTDSKVPDAQSGFETMQNLMLCVLGGATVINECLGCLDAIMTTSLEKIIMDEEMISRVFRIVEGFMDIDYDLCLDQIHRVGSGNDYMTLPFTLKNCRRAWRPSISNIDLYEIWAKNGSLDTLERAAAKYKAKLAAAPPSVADPEVLKALEPYLTRL
jgi:trimethylamine--corrinoid protein Co-methyltransferase